MSKRESQPMLGVLWSRFGMDWDGMLYLRTGWKLSTDQRVSPGVMLLEQDSPENKHLNPILSLWYSAVVMLHSFYKDMPKCLEKFFLNYLIYKWYHVSWFDGFCWLSFFFLCIDFATLHLFVYMSSCNNTVCVIAVHMWCVEQIKQFV